MLGITQFSFEDYNNNDNNMSYLALVSYIIGILINILSLYALRNVIPSILLLQIISSIICTVIVGMTLHFFLLDAIMVLWAVWTFHRAYIWAKYFKNGGIYDRNMINPPRGGVRRVRR